MKNIFNILVGELLLVPSEKSLGQKQFLHLTYKPTSCIVIDSLIAFEEYDMGFGFIRNGIPFQYEVNDGLFSARVESVLKPETDLPDSIFTIEPGMSEVHLHYFKMPVRRRPDLLSPP